MIQSIFVLSNKENQYVANRMLKAIPSSRIKFADTLDESALVDMSNNCIGDFFYVVSVHQEICFQNFKFTFVPSAWDKDYVHIWNNDTSIRLFNKQSVLENPSKYTDRALLHGEVRLKSIPERIFTYPVFDIIFLSYDEYHATVNYQNLKSRFSRLKHVAGVSGIYQAHKAAAKIADTDMFYVVDADAEVCGTFNFDYIPHSLDRESVHVWHSLNPVNGLTYGYGGVKLFPTNLLLEYAGSPVDFTTSVAKSFKVVPEISNITRFDTDPFSAWRSAFRECTKLAAKVVANREDTESSTRLDVWCSQGADTAFGDFVLLGAQAGREFGTKFANQPEQLVMINDFKWLENKFNS